MKMELNNKMIVSLYEILASQEEKDSLKEQLRKLELGAKEVTVRDYINKEGYGVSHVQKLISKDVERKIKSVYGDGVVLLKNLSMDEIIKEFRSRYILWGIREVKVISHDILLAKCQHGFLKVEIDRLYNDFNAEQIKEEEYNDYSITVDEYCDVVVSIMEEKYKY